MKEIPLGNGVIKFDGKHKHIGSFTTVEEAAAAYNRIAIELFGEFAKPNEAGM